MTFTPRHATPAGNPASDATQAAELKLYAAAERGASERTLDRLRVLFHLAQLHDDGIVKSLTKSGGNPRYLLDATGFRGERAYTISELEAFVHGVDAARGL